MVFRIFDEERFIAPMERNESFLRKPGRKRDFPREKRAEGQRFSSLRSSK